MLASPPQVSACLVCTLQSADGDGAPALAGTCEVSLVPPQSSKYVQALRVPNDGESCYMSNMTVAPAFRRRGVGTALLSAMESFALTWRPMGALAADGDAPPVKRHTPARCPSPAADALRGWTPLLVHRRLRRVPPRPPHG